MFKFLHNLLFPLTNSVGLSSCGCELCGPRNSLRRFPSLLRIWRSPLFRSLGSLAWLDHTTKFRSNSPNISTSFILNTFYFFVLLQITLIGRTWDDDWNFANICSCKYGGHFPRIVHLVRGDISKVVVLLEALQTLFLIFSTNLKWFQFTQKIHETFTKS